MSMDKSLFYMLLCLILVVAAGCGDLGRTSVPAQRDYDIVVYGGTSAGVAAAVQASRMGKSVILIEPGKHLGGLSSGGLGATDIGNKNAIGGISKEFYHRLYIHYLKQDSWKQEKRLHFLRRYKDWERTQTWWQFEPHAAEIIFNQMIDEAKIPVLFGQRLDLEDGVEKQGSMIVSLKTESGHRFYGKMFIDATYEGDLMAMAGVSYTVGRESNEKYGETLNGVQTQNAVHHQFNLPVDPYVTEGDSSSGLLPWIDPDGPGAEGSGDKRVQAYNFRLCLTDIKENQVPFRKPEGYDPLEYELLFRYFEAGFNKMPWINSRMPNRKTDINNKEAVSSDYIGANYDYPEADYATREKIIQAHYTYQMGLMWTLANHPRVPNYVRRTVSKWGLAKDEFEDNGHWPHQIYVREARRMVSDYVMTEHNCKRKIICDDPVGMAAYTMDSHNTQRYVNSMGHVRNEGDVQVRVSPYPISYGSIVPKQNECTNLLVPVCLSASHIAFGSIRMEPVFMILGQSAATAATIAIDDQVNIQDVDYDSLKERLSEDKQVLTYIKDLKH